MTRVSGVHALITGGSSGIGLAVARQLVVKGATVSLIARGAERLAEAADQLRAEGATVHTASVDVSDATAVTRAIAGLVEVAGPVDVLVTAAGQAMPGRFLELDEAVFRTMMEVDYFGTLHAVRAVAPSMVERGRGSIVAVASGAGLHGFYGYTAYGAAKFAVRGLMEALRSELKPHRVHVACVYPPDVDTPQLAEENRYKPAETAAITGAVKPMAADAVAAKIVRAIERRRFAVYPSPSVAALAGLGPMFAPLLRRYADRKIRKVQARSWQPKSPADDAGSERSPAHTRVYGGGVSAPVPFRRGRFEQLPAQPRRPHGYFATRVEELQVTTDELGTTRAHVRVHGSGPPLLLVHGLMTSSYSWRYVLEPLGARFTLYMPDLPGSGRSDRPLDRPYHPEALASWIGAVQRGLDIRGCPVIGNSMGGYLCMRLALRDPAAMSRLVNVHSPGVPEARLYAAGAAFAVPGMGGLVAWLARRDPARWAHRHVHYWDESLKSLEEAREYGEPLSSRDGSRAFVKYLAETMAIGPIRDFQRTLAARQARGEPFPVPLLLVYAERDPMVPPRFGDVLAARIPNARLVRLAEASHFAHVDAVERFIPPVLKFLAE